MAPPPACARRCSDCSIARNSSSPDGEGGPTVTMTRREWIRLGLGTPTLLACGTTVPAFLARSAHALSDGPGRLDDGRVLVVVQLDGGNDGLNTFVLHG